MIDPLYKGDLIRQIKDLQARVLTLESKKTTTLNFGTTGVLVIPQLSADPVAPNLTDGMIWENTTSHTFKIYINGVVKTVTIT